jgi:hypothetical protein
MRPSLPALMLTQDTYDLSFSFTPMPRVL